MAEPDEKLCPFDKNPCIQVRCAVWAVDEQFCAFALIPRMPPGPGSQVRRQKEHPVSSGLSGKYKDPLFG